MGNIKIKKNKKIILDTNFLVYCAKQKIDYASQISGLISEACELVVPEQVVEELKALGDEAKKFSDKQAAKLALQLLKHNNVKTIKSNVSISNGYADEAILFLVRENKDSIVATIDRELKGKINNAIVIEGRKKLVMT